MSQRTSEPPDLEAIETFAKLWPGPSDGWVKTHLTTLIAEVRRLKVLSASQAEALDAIDRGVKL